DRLSVVLTRRSIIPAEVVLAERSTRKGICSARRAWGIGHGACATSPTTCSEADGAGRREGYDYEYPPRVPHRPRPGRDDRVLSRHLRAERGRRTRVAQRLRRARPGLRERACPPDHAGERRGLGPTGTRPIS